MKIDKIIENEISVEKDKLQKLEKAKEINDQIYNYRKKVQNIQNEMNLPIAIEKFNFFQKIFSKKYRDYKKMIEAKENKAIELEKSIENYENLIKEKVEQVDLIIKNDISLQNTTISKINEKLNNLESREKSIEYFLKEQPYKCGDIEFMKAILEIDKNNIIYDKTNDCSLYESFIKDSYKKLDSQGYNNLPNIDDLISKLSMPDYVFENQAEGGYKIPPKMLFDAIRKSIQIEKSSMVAKTVDAVVLDYINMDEKFSIGYGQKMFELYNDKDNYVAVHGICRSNSGGDNLEIAENVKNSIFSKGLKATNSMGELVKMNSAPRLSATIMCQDSNQLDFFKLLDYDYSDSAGFIVMQIPKNYSNKNNPVAIWGTNDKNDVNGENREFYILPQYIKGFVQRQYPDKNKTKIPYNEKKLENKVDYEKDQKYLKKVFDSEYSYECVFEKDSER